MLPPPADTAFHPSQAPQGETEFTLDAGARHDRRGQGRRPYRRGGAQEDRRQAGAVRHRHGGGAIPDARNWKSRSTRRLVAAAKTEAQKVELYTASRLTIDPDTRAERGYLDLLAGRLGLPDALVDHVEATVSAAKEPVPCRSTRGPRATSPSPTRRGAAPALVGARGLSPACGVTRETSRPQRFGYRLACEVRQPGTSCAWRSAGSRRRAPATRRPRCRAAPRLLSSGCAAAGIEPMLSTRLRNAALALAARSQRIVKVGALRPEHQVEQRRVGQRELDIGDARGNQPVARGRIGPGTGATSIAR